MIFDISLGKKEKTCICTEKPETPSAKAKRGFVNLPSVILVAYIFSQAEVNSKNGEIRVKRISFLIRVLRSADMPEKKIIYAHTLIDEYAADRTDSTKLNVCPEITLVIFIFSEDDLNIIPVSIAENIVHKYSFIPKDRLPNIPAPIPDITKAADGLFTYPFKEDNSFSLIFPWLKRSTAVFAPSGNPQTAPTINADKPDGLIFNIRENTLANMPFSLNSIDDIQRSDKIKNGKSVGTTFMTERRSPFIIPAFISLPRKIAIISNARQIYRETTLGSCFFFFLVAISVIFSPAIHTF